MSSGNPYSFARRWKRALSETTWFDPDRDIGPVIVVVVAAIIMRAVWAADPQHRHTEASDGLVILAWSVLALLLYFVAFSVLPFVHKLAQAGSRNALDEPTTARDLDPMTLLEASAQAPGGAGTPSDGGLHDTTER